MISVLQRDYLRSMQSFDRPCSTTEVAEIRGELRRRAANAFRRLAEPGYIQVVGKGGKKGGAHLFIVTSKGQQVIDTYDAAVKETGKPPSPRHGGFFPSAIPQSTGVGAKYEPYVPATWQSVRPGADDHKQYQSRGF